MSAQSYIDATVLVDSVDVSTHVEPTGFQVTSVITAKLDTSQFTLRNAGSLSVNKWDEIIIKDGLDKIFAGFILNTDEKEGLDAELEISTYASDYASYFDHVQVIAEYTGETDKAIAQDLFAKHLAGMGFTATTYFTAITNHSRVRFNRKTLRQCLDMLASYAGAEWYIDYEKRLHFFTGIESNAPYKISESPDLVNTFALSNLVVSKDGTDIVNRVEVVGGDFLSEDTIFYIAGTGQDSRVLIPFKMSAPVGESALQVWRNDGTELTPTWTSLTVKVGYLDSLTDANDVLLYYQEKVLETLSDLPELPNAVKVHGRYNVPVRVRIPSTESYDFHDSIWFDDKIVDPDISDKGTARLRAKSLLLQKAYERTSLKFNVSKSGLFAGQTVSIENETHELGSGISFIVTQAGEPIVTQAGENIVTQEEYEDFTIQRVTAKIGIGGKVVYSISCGDYNPDLVDLLLANHRATSQSPLWNDTERLDYLLEYSESIEVAEGTPTLSTVGPTYYYSDTPSTAFIFGKAAFRN